MDYYKILGVNKTDSKDTIKKAYRQLALKYHPDKNKDPEAEDKFKEVSEAWGVLGDDDNREKYDKMGDNFFRSGVSASYSPYSNIDIDVDNFFNDFFQNININRQRRNTAYQTQNQWKNSRPIKGPDIIIPVYISFKDSANGFESDIQIERRETCHKCNGSGNHEDGNCSICAGKGVIRGEICRLCRGSGRVFKTCTMCLGSKTITAGKNIHFKSPPGIRTGSYLRFAKMGHIGRNGGNYGDAFIEIKVKPHKFFSRTEDEVHCVWHISFVDAILGTKVQVPTIYNTSLNLKIPQGIQPGSKIRILGFGFKNMSGNKGSMFVTVEIIIPKTITPKQKELLEQYKNLT